MSHNVNSLDTYTITCDQANFLFVYKAVVDKTTYNAKIRNLCHCMIVNPGASKTLKLNFHNYNVIFLSKVDVSVNIEINARNLICLSKIATKGKMTLNAGKVFTMPCSLKADQFMGSCENFSLFYADKSRVAMIRGLFFNAFTLTSDDEVLDRATETLMEVLDLLKSHTVKKDFVKVEHFDWNEACNILGTQTTESTAEEKVDSKEESKKEVCYKD